MDMNNAQQESLNAMYNERLKALTGAQGATGTSVGPLGPTDPLAGSTLTISTPATTTSASFSGKHATWMTMDDVWEEPSVERLFSIMKNLDTELDNLRAKKWGKYSPRRATLWWKRLGFKTRLDALMVSPLAGLALWLVVGTTMAGWNKEWWFGMLVAYGWAGFAYVAYRIITSDD